MYCRSSGPTDSRRRRACPITGKLRSRACWRWVRSRAATAATTEAAAAGRVQCRRLMTGVCSASRRGTLARPVQRPADDDERRAEGEVAEVPGERPAEVVTHVVHPEDEVVHHAFGLTAEARPN